MSAQLFETFNKVSMRELSRGHGLMKLVQLKSVPIAVRAGPGAQFLGTSITPNSWRQK